MSLAPGTVLGGHFELERELGRGGMGVVWLARNRFLDSQDAWFARALARGIEHRFASARELVEAFVDAVGSAAAVVGEPPTAGAAVSADDGAGLAFAATQLATAGSGAAFLSCTTARLSSHRWGAGAVGSVSFSVSLLRSQP